MTADRSGLDAQFPAPLQGRGELRDQPADRRTVNQCLAAGRVTHWPLTQPLTVS